MAFSFCVILTFSLPLTIFAGTECDVSKGEVFVGGIQVSDYEACEKSCLDEPKCVSITYYDSGSCSHFGTECTNTIQTGNNCITKTLKKEASNHQECDTEQGEIFLSKSQGSGVAACKKSCEDDAQCQSIVYYSHGSCSLFSTKCEKRKPADNAHTEFVKEIKVQDDEGTCKIGEQCDVENGEIWFEDGSGKVADYAACKKACMDRIRCQSITYYAHGWCSLFKTQCTHRRPAVGAIAENLKQDLFNREECDMTQGEVYLPESSDYYPTKEACRKSCMDEPKCNSITFYKSSGWCSHFSTYCLKRKATANADAMRVKGPNAGSFEPTQSPPPDPPRSHLDPLYASYG